MAGLYLHIPYCVKKCDYCDFTSFPLDDTLGDYVAALCGEIALTAKANLCAGPFDTAYLGGGTPSLLGGDQLGRVMDALREHFPLVSGAECSMECNPGTASAENLRAYRVSGVNRLSVGLQTSHDSLLASVGRIHTYAQFRDTIKAARAAGFENISVDVMHGLPGQTQKAYLDTLRVVCDMDVQHVSSYALTLAEDTPLGRRVKSGEIVLPDADAVADMQDAGIDYLASRGYLRYEISNFAREGYACRHNLNYWNNGEYLGFGVAAHSAVRMREWTRYANVDTIREYLRLIGRKRRPVREIIRLFPADEMFESVMLGLRLTAGVDRAAFRARFGVDLADAYASAMECLRERGWVVETPERICLTRRGLDLQNEALGYFM